MKPPVAKHPAVELVERVKQERQAQGLPPTVDDPEALRKLAALVTENGRRRA